MSTTIKDIARILNLSTSTVSRALRGHPDINAETRALVLKTADDLDYQPNSLAQNLKSQRSNTIGVIVPQVKHVFFAEIMSGITEVAYEADFNVIISQSNENFDREVKNVQAMISQRVAGILMSISATTKDYSHLFSLQRRKIPLVCFDRVPEGIEVNRVLVNDYEGAFQAVEHLIQRGYKRIAHLSGPRELSISRKRFEGYRDALLKHDMPIDESLIVHGGLNEADGEESYARLCKQAEKKPDAIFAVTDPVAIGAFSQIKAAGLRIPNDVALVGFSDNPVDSLIDPPLATVRQPAHKIGEFAARFLIEDILDGDREKPAETKILQTELVIRQST